MSGALQPTDLLFYLVAGLTVGSAAGVAFSRSIVYAGLSLLGTLLGVGALYVFLAADFLAVTQLLIYVGGVLVLILFAVMLTSRIQEIRVSNQSAGRVAAVVVALALAGLTVFVAVGAPWQLGPPGPYEPTTAKLGRLLLHAYLLPFELASLLLLGALVGAVVIARKEPGP